MRLSQALRRMGIEQGDRVATLAMNHQPPPRRACTASSARAAVLHTLNPRLFDDQLDYIANHAEDRVLLYDAVVRRRWSSG